MRHGAMLGPRATPAELLDNSTYQGMKMVTQKKQEQARFEQEQLDRRKREIAEEQEKLNVERKRMKEEMSRMTAEAETREKG